MSKYYRYYIDNWIDNGPHETLSQWLSSKSRVGDEFVCFVESNKNWDCLFRYEVTEDPDSE